MNAAPLTVYLPDTRDVNISRFGIGNRKIGFGVFTYSRSAGGLHTCPGATEECESICYAKRIHGPVKDVYERNSYTDDVPPIPVDCKVLRIHISGDFDSIEYIQNWGMRLLDRQDVTCWAYTRSWRVKHLLPALELLRALPNMQLFASMDASTPELPPDGWRRAWIYRDQARYGYPMESRLYNRGSVQWLQQAPLTRNQLAMTDIDHITPSFVCPEETGHKPDCLSCGYCFEGKKHDVTFVEHHGRPAAD